MALSPRGEGRQPLGAARPLIFPLFLSPSPPIESTSPHREKTPSLVSRYLDNSKESRITGESSNLIRL